MAQTLRQVYNVRNYGSPPSGREHPGATSQEKHLRGPSPKFAKIEKVKLAKHRIDRRG